MNGSQVYVVPLRDGVSPWGALVYGDEVVPDDSIVPLPLGGVAYGEAEAFVRTTPMGREASVVDGWESEAQMRECGEGDLADRIWSV